MKNKITSLLWVGFAALVLVLISGFVFTFEGFTALKSYGEEPSYKVYALELPDSLSFAGEIVPLHSPDLKERLDRELLVNTYWQSNMMLLLKRANKYFPTIEKILKEEGVPTDLKYLSVIESGLENVISPAGAKGFWQIMRTTGREYGLEVNSNVDERYHIVSSTRMAAQYLKKAKDKFGSWTLAAASYNRGMSGIQRNLNAQEVESYFDLLLGKETSRYVFRILAVKEIIENPSKYGYVFDNTDLYYSVPVRYHGLDTAISNLTSFAQKMGINYKVLKIHNPWLLQNHLNNKSRKYYEIAIPEKGYY
ncbi:MAG: lytic transglycosylase domain-containing protein [Flavobacteriaceae bacterium TMED42]|nr:MAG: lytic transglycosylase domain-containing protein [Flavobacteriaceae bacterium TMED42]|tara:strand:+ start:773 stop:1696 length:924 start_codon:yes stop_codon:yes gene_type:complete